jgi:hypothetical protein
MYKLHDKRQQYVQCVAMMGNLGEGTTYSFDQYVALYFRTIWRPERTIGREVASTGEAKTVGLEGKGLILFVRGVETLARFRPDLSLLAELDAIEGKDYFVALGTLPRDWLTVRTGQTLENCAIFEPFLLQHATSKELYEDDPDLLGALRFHGIRFPLAFPK